MRLENTPKSITLLVNMKIQEVIKNGLFDQNKNADSMLVQADSHAQWFCRENLWNVISVQAAYDQM